MYGLISFDALRLVPPRRSDIRSHGSSTMKAVARWKFSGKEQQQQQQQYSKGEAEWLSFAKGEVITNIGCELNIYSVGSLLLSSLDSDAEGLTGSHQDHWCWRGTNAKGKSGLFPRSHIEPGTLMEAPDRLTVSSGERRSGLLSRISIRNRSSGSGALGGDGSSTSFQ